MEISDINSANILGLKAVLYVIENYKSILKNLIYSFLSFAMPSAVLVFFVQPAIAFRLGSRLNGQYLTVMALIFFMTSVTAGVLSNVRLLLNKSYEEQQVEGDFNVIFVIYMLIELLLLPFCYSFYIEEIDVLDIVLFVIIGWLYLYQVKSI